MSDDKPNDRARDDAKTVVCKSCNGTGIDPVTAGSHRVCGGKGRTRPRGFAALSPAHVSEIARKGGQKAHAAGVAHEFTSAEAREAGRIGGKATHAKRKAARST